MNVYKYSAKILTDQWVFVKIFRIIFDYSFQNSFSKNSHIKSEFCRLKKILQIIWNTLYNPRVETYWFITICKTCKIFSNIYLTAINHIKENKRYFVEQIWNHNSIQSFDFVLILVSISNIFFRHQKCVVKSARFCHRPMKI